MQTSSLSGGSTPMTRHFARKGGHSVIDGLIYLQNHTPKELSDAIVRDLTSASDWFPVSQSESARRVRHYGYRYNYRSGVASEPAAPIPPLYRQLIDLIPHDLNFTPEQLIINEYQPGQGIARHIDSRAYGPVIACFTFGGGAEMEFRYAGAVVRIYTEPDSLYVMTGDARSKWSHEMRKRKFDTVDGVKTPRTTRWSVTFRSLA